MIQPIRTPNSLNESIVTKLVKDIYLLSIIFSLIWRGKRDPFPAQEAFVHGGHYLFINLEFNIMNVIGILFAHEYPNECCEIRFRIL